MMEPMMWYFLTGILERHPNLKIVWVEPGLFWIPGFLEFLDRRMHQHYDFPGVKELPSTYWKRQMAVTFVDEPEAVNNRYELGIEIFFGQLISRIPVVTGQRTSQSC